MIELDLKNKIMNNIDNNKNLLIYCFNESFLDYEKWCDKFENEINIELAETGCDREMDFDADLEFDKRYEMYLNNNSK